MGPNQSSPSFNYIHRIMLNLESKFKTKKIWQKKLKEDNTTITNLRNSDCSVS